jgi:hypothetical protein
MFARSVIAGVLVLEWAALAQGCPPSSMWNRPDPLVVEYRKRPVALLVEACGEGDLDQPKEPRQRVRVVEVLHDATGVWRANRLYDYAIGSSPSESGRWLMLGNYEPSEPDWRIDEGRSAALISFLKSVREPLSHSDALARVLIDHLEHADPLVAESAYSAFEFWYVPPAPVIRPLRSLAPLFPRNKLRTWVTNPETWPSRLGLYGVMLGLCVTEEDIPLLEQRVVEVQEDEFRLGIDGVMAGYLLLAGERGLETLERTKIDDKSAQFSETYAALLALRYMRQYGEGRIPLERLKRSLRRLLHRTELADIVVADLARWKDWEVMEDVVKLYGAKDYDFPSMRRAIVRYMFAAIKDVPKDAKPTDPLPPHAAVAKHYLEALRGNDPKLVRDVERFLY